MPLNLRVAISVGIGLFITLVGLADAGIAGSPLVQLGVGGSLMGWPIFVFVATFFLLAVPAPAQGTRVDVVGDHCRHRARRHPGGGDPHRPQNQGANPTGWALNVPAFPGMGAFTAPDLSLLGRIDILGGFAPDRTTPWPAS